MAYRVPLAEDAPFSVQLKHLADEELLDFWAETQQLEHLLLRDHRVGTPDFERQIVLELQLRSCYQEGKSSSLS